MADYSLLNEPEMAEIFSSFLIESREIFEKLDVDLIELESNPEDADLLNQVFRSFHTIKGTAGFLGLEKLQKVTHRGEDILNKLRKGEMKLNQEIMDAILEGFDCIKGLVDVIEANKNEDYDTSSVITKMQAILDGASGSSSSDDIVTVDEPKEAEKTVPEKNEEIEEEEVPEVKEEAKPEIKPEAEKISKVKVPQVQRKTENTIRVDVERLDNLLNLVSELVLGRNMLSQITQDVVLNYEGTKLARDLRETSQHIDRMTTELHLAVMKTRMIKIGKVFNKFPRVVRDLARDTGKKVQLVIKGEETELDKTLIEEINDPLVHLVRNSIDHGVETPEERIAAGKDEIGTVTLSAEHEGDHIIISIEDDGKGIDAEQIKRKAINKGLISEEKAAELSKQELLNLIFLPGFSTAEKITNISGRGVGMDVVKTNVTKLRGIITIDSEVGKGTKMSIKLPLTLAIIRGLLVKVGEESVVIPLSSVIEVVKVPKDEIYFINQKEVIKLRDGVLPLLSIAELLYDKDENDDDKDWKYIVIVGIAEKKYGIKVDDLIGQNEAVIKSLGKYLGEIEGIAGSTIMGDGKVVMIADIAELVHKLAERENAKN